MKTDHVQKIKFWENLRKLYNVQVCVRNMGGSPGELSEELVT